MVVACNPATGEVLGPFTGTLLQNGVTLLGSATPHTAAVYQIARA